MISCLLCTGIVYIASSLTESVRTGLQRVLEEAQCFRLG